MVEKDIRGVKLGMLRGEMGMVQQEAVLFDRSIAGNIRYGDCTREASMEEVVNAAKGANIHNFVMSLPDVSFIKLIESLSHFVSLVLWW